MAKKASKHRKLSAQEQSLWQKVTKDVVVTASVEAPKTILEQAPIAAIKKPLSRKSLKSSAADVQQTVPLESGYLLKLMQRFDGGNHPAHNVEIGKMATPQLRAAKQHSYRANEPQTKPQNLPLDRNTRQKLQRGRADIEARLDLHGYNRDNAQTRLMSFLRSSWQQGFKTVIVVTGKGDGAIARHSLHSADFFTMPEQKAVLRASIGDWLNSAEAAQFVIGWQPAHPKHGGGGAVYVRLRSRKNR